MTDQATLDFTFMDDPGWKDVEDKSGIIDVAFQRDIMSDPGWKDVKEEDRQGLYDIYRQQAVEYNKSKQPKAEGILGSLVGGVKEAASSVKTAFNVYTGDEEEAKETAIKATEILKTEEQQAFMQSLQANKEIFGDETVFQGLKNVANAAWKNPTGAMHEVFAQLPNSGVILGSMATGTALGSTLGPIGSITGGILGLIFGNVAIETGGIAKEEILSGEYDSADIIKKGAVKGGFISGIDIATMGTVKLMYSPVYKAAKKATDLAINTRLIAKGIDPLDNIAVKAAMQNKELVRELRTVGAKAAKGTMPKGSKAAALFGSGLLLDMTGEGVGEYGGSVMAGLDASLTEAVMEATMSIPQSVGEVTIGKTMAQISSIGKGKDIDEVVSAFENGLMAPSKISPKVIGSLNDKRAALDNIVDETTRQFEADLGSTFTGEFDQGMWDAEIKKREEAAQRSKPYVGKGKAPTDEEIVKAAEALVNEYKTSPYQKTREENQQRINALGGLEEVEKNIAAFNESISKEERERSAQALRNMQERNKQQGAWANRDLGIPETNESEWGKVESRENSVKALEKRQADMKGLKPDILATPEAPLMSEKDEKGLEEINQAPTDPQKESGGYKKAHPSIDGFQMSIENAAGSTRKGTDEAGKAWSQTMESHYGYFNRTEGKDGDQVDAFIKPGGAKGKPFFVIDQFNKDGSFDEHKVMIGFETEQEARDAYLANYEDGWTGLGNITEMDKETFKEWLGDKKRTKKPAFKGGDSRLKIEEFEGRSGDRSHTTRIETGTIKTKDITHLKGESGEIRGEHRNKKGEKWEEFKADIKKNGITEPILILKDPGKDAVVSEGNHRLDAAIDLGLETIPVDIRYFGHSERDGLAYDKPSEKEEAEVKEEPPIVPTEDNNNFEPGDKVSFKTKKGTLTGEIVSIRGDKWTVRKDDGGLTTVNPDTQDMKIFKGDAKAPLDSKEDSTPLKKDHEDYDGMKYLGKNEDGKNIYEDEETVRSIEELPGVFSTQPISIVPGVGNTKEGAGLLYDRGRTEYLTVEEIAEKKVYERLGEEQTIREKITKNLGEDFKLIVPGDLMPFGDGTMSENKVLDYSVISPGLFVVGQGKTAQEAYDEAIAWNDRETGEGGDKETTTEEKEAPIKEQMTDFIASQLIKGVFFKNITEARKTVSEKFGTPIKPGTQEAKDLDEAIELAGVIVARRSIKIGRKNNLPVNEIFDVLVELQSQLPNLSVRTSTSVQNQAYSTPLPIAYLASELAGIDYLTTVYEPSAGNGALLIGADKKKSVVNEMNEERADNLRSQGYQHVYQKDGTIIDISQKRDVVIGNPPFGAVKDDNGVSKTWKINDQYTTTQVDHAMVFKALEAMKNGGRAVFIVGSVSDKSTNPDTRKILYRAKSKVEFYKTLFNGYNVVDHFTIAGKLYSQQGAAWPVDIIVIDGKGGNNRTLPGAVPPIYLSTIEEVRGKLNEITRMDDTGGGQTGTGVRSGEDLAGQGDNGTGVSTSPDGTSTETDRPGRGPSEAGTTPGGETLGSGNTGRDGGTKPEDSSDGSTPGERPISGLPGDDGSGGTPSDKETPGDGQTGRTDTETGEEPGTGTIPGQPDTSVEDEFSPDNLLAEWDKQADSAGVKAAEAKKHLSNAADKFKQINNIIGERGSFSTKGVDESVYSQVKVLLQEALNDIIAAGKAAKDFVKLAIENLSTKARPYFERFVRNDMVIPAEKAPVKKPAKKKIKKANDQTGTDSQVPYAPASNSSAIGTLTPVNMADASKKALAKITKKHGSVDEYVAKELGYTMEEIVGKDGEYGYFSGEQVDAIALAISNIDSGTGFIIGDQTGVGKGRVVAAMMRFAMRNGLTPIFVTEKPNLYADMYRDFSDIGMADIASRILITNNNETIPLSEDGKTVIKTKSNHTSKILNSIRDAGKLPSKYDVIFTTYNQMNQVGDSPRRTFLEVMTEQNGMLIMDESHNAGGSSGVRETAQKLPRSIWFRRLVNSAHSVFYSSATYAKRPDTMDLYSRTDMRLAVDDIEMLGAAISRGGVPLQQAVAAMLVKAGQYVRRERSFEGVPYDVHTVPVDTQKAEEMSITFKEIFDFSSVFAEPAVDGVADDGAATGVGIAGGSSASGGEVSTTGFSSIMHNIIGQSLLALKTQAAIDEAIKAFKGDPKNPSQKPVITLANTMGSFIEQYAIENELKPGDAIGLKFNDILFSYLDKTRRYREQDPFQRGQAIQHYLTDEQLGPEGVREYNRIKNYIYSLNLDGIPVSPVDYIKMKLKEAGMTVEEITGRGHTIEYKADGTQIYRMRGLKDKNIAAKLKTIANFNKDKTDALVINQSGSTGLSLHALPKWEGHDPAARTMILLQAEANIDTHMQMLGRVHRAGQVKPPSYIQLAADIATEKRPAAVLAGKMASLNANTTAAKEGDLSAKDTVDFINKYGDRVVAGLMADFPEIHLSLGGPLPTAPNTESGLQEDGAARKITGRIPLLTSITEQEELYNMIESDYLSLIERLNATGQNDLEAKTFDTDAKTLQKATVFKGENNSDSPFTDPAYAEKVDMKKIGKSYTSDEVIELLREYITGDKRSRETLEALVRAGFENQQIKGFDAIEAFEEYKADYLDSIEKEERRIAAELRLNAIKANWMSMANLTIPGRVLEIPIGDRYFNTVVLKTEQTGTPKNPLAMGTWKVTVAVPDSTRRLTIPFSFLSRMTGAAGNGSVTSSDLDGFDRASHSAREERTLMTGNLLAAFSQYPRGRIINFTNDKGVVRQGVLMPADFDLEAAARENKVVLNNIEDVMAVMNADIHIKSRRGDLKISQRFGTFYLSVPSSRAGGSKYFLNSGLLNAIGSDFIRVGNRMRAGVPRSNITDVMSHLLNNMEEVFENSTDSDRVRDILGIEVPTFDDSSVRLQTDQDRTPGQGVTLKDIQSKFKGQDVFISPDGSISVRLKNGQGINITSVKTMNNGDIAYAIETGRMEKDGIILGKATGNTITLNRDYADSFTLMHEIKHVLDNLGILTESDNNVINGRLKIFSKRGTLGFKLSTSKDPAIARDENLANAFAQFMQDREQHRGTIIGKILQKVTDFLDGVWHIGRQSSRKLAREFESGDIFNREGGKKPGIVKLGKAKIWGLLIDKKFQVEAWHGSPPVVEGGFQDDKIGTGEGAQAFGWGHYMTESEFVARGYAEMDRRNLILYDGKEYRGIQDLRNSLVKQYGKENDDVIFSILYDFNSGYWEEDIINRVKNKWPGSDDLANEILNGLETPDLEKGWKINLSKRIGKTLSGYERGLLFDMRAGLHWYSDKVNVSEKIKQDLNKTISTQTENIEYAKEHYSEKDKKEEIKKSKKWIKDSKDKLDLINKYSLKAVYERGRRNLYKVTIHKGKDPSEYSWLEWEEGITDSQFDQIEKAMTDDGLPVHEILRPVRMKDGKMMGNGWVSKAYREQHIEEGSTFNYPSGHKLYYEINQFLGSPQKASQFLLKHGISGIKYPAGTLSGGNKSGAYNYVVFDPKDITIEEHQQFQTSADRIVNAPRVSIPKKILTGFKNIVFPKDGVITRGLAGINSVWDAKENKWFSVKDLEIHRTAVEAMNLQKDLLSAMGKKTYSQPVKDMDMAIHIYLDLKRNPGHLAKYYNKLSPEGKKIADLAESIDNRPEIKKIANQIAESYEELGELAKSEEVIRETIENYVGRAWKFENKASTQLFNKFVTNSRHSKQRVFETILEGMGEAGMELQIKGAINNLKTVKDEITKVIEDKRLLKELQQTEHLDTGEKIFTDKTGLEGYKKLEGWNFTVMKPYGSVKGGKTKDTFVTEEGKVIKLGKNARVQTRWAAENPETGRSYKNFDKKQDAIDWIFDNEKGELQERTTLWERRPLFAPEEIADRLNKITGRSVLSGKFKVGGVSVVDTMTKYNALAKSTLLMTGLFHHQAFFRSYLFGTRNKTAHEWRPIKAYKEGLEAIQSSHPQIELGVKNGLTIGLMQDWMEDILKNNDTVFGKAMDKIGLKSVREKINNLRERQAKFLFGSLGAGLKAKAFIIEYRNAVQEHPNMEENARARMVAALINADFGGLHLGRMGRDPTLQHIFRLVALAPDWTESNILSMARAIKSGGKIETEMYRKFWLSIFTKSLGATLAINIALSLASGDNDDEFIDKFKRSWKNGNLKWMDVNITPLYKGMGGKEESEKYFSLIGHFRDPIKFIIKPIVSAQHKGSVLYGFFHELFTGTDWKGEKFTTMQELIGVDDKGIYVTTRKGKYSAGEKKGGKLAGQTVSFRSDAKGGPIHLNQIPSYMISQGKGILPIQIQSLLAWSSGEQNWFDAITKGAGFYTSTTYPSKKKTEGQFVEEYVYLKNNRKNLMQLLKKVREYNNRRKEAGKDEDIVSWDKVTKKANKRLIAENLSTFYKGD